MKIFRTERLLKNCLIPAGLSSNNINFVSRALSFVDCKFAYKSHPYICLNLPENVINKETLLIFRGFSESPQAMQIDGKNQPAQNCHPAMACISLEENFNYLICHFSLMSIPKLLHFNF